MIRHRYESEFDIEYKFKVGDWVIYRGNNSVGVQQGDKGVVHDMHFDQEDAYDSNWYRVDFKLSGRRNVYEKNLELDPIQNRYNNLKKLYGEEVDSDPAPKFQVGDRVIVFVREGKLIRGVITEVKREVGVANFTPYRILYLVMYDSVDRTNLFGYWTEDRLEIDEVGNRYRNLSKLYGEEVDSDPEPKFKVGDRVRVINPIHRNSFGKWLGKIIKVGKIEEWWDYIVTFTEKEDGHYAFNESDLELDEVSRRYNNLKKLYGEPK